MLFVKRRENEQRELCHRANCLKTFIDDNVVNSGDNQQIGFCVCSTINTDFVFDILLVRERVDQEIFVFNVFRHSTKGFCGRETTTVACCDFDGASICDSWTGLCLGGPRPDLGPGGCWESAVGASRTAQQAVRDRVKENCRATSRAMSCATSRATSHATSCATRRATSRAASCATTAQRAVQRAA